MNINVTIAGKTYSVKIEDLHARPVKAEVNGQVFEVWPEEDAPQPVQAQSVPATVSTVKASAAPTQTAVNLQEVRSPLPGVIVAIEVKPGDAVRAGQPMMYLLAEGLSRTWQSILILTKQKRTSTSSHIICGN